MAYTINHYDQSQLTVIADGTIDNTTDLKLIGKNYAGYGEVQNENLVYLLENFAGTDIPAKPVQGQMWYDSGANKLKFYDKNSNWRTTGGSETGSSAPTGLTTGDFWWDSGNKQLYASNGDNTYTLVGPQGVVGSGTTQMISRSVLDDQEIPVGHPIIEAVIDDATAYIVSTDEFTLGDDNPIPGFSIIKKGLTLAYSSPTTGAPLADYIYWGTAANATRLGGVDASNFVQAGSANFDLPVHFGDQGFYVGNSDNLQVFIESSTLVVIDNQQSDTIEIRTRVGGTPKTPLKFIGSNTRPGADNVSELGSSSYKFANVYATTFTGTATQANTLNVSGNYRTAAIATSANTIPVRDASGDIFATVFRGTATSAQFADLAEKYLADAEYAPGTVVCVGGEKEVTASSWGKRAIGVVSTNPAFKMNSEQEGGTYIALKGRVPCNVIGSVKKGDQLIASDNGCAVVAVPHSSGVFAVALDSSDDTGVKSIEVLVL